MRGTVSLKPRSRRPGRRSCDASRSTHRQGDHVETWDAITSRRHVREFASRAIADDDLVRILEAGRRAPSSQNWQPWDFVAVTGRGELTELARVWRGGRGGGPARG